MTKLPIPVSSRQILLLGLLTLGPLLAVAVASAKSPSNANLSPTELQLGWAIIIALTVGLAGVLAATATRHLLSLDAQALTVRHSLYTLRIDRKDVTALRVERLSNLHSLDLGLRTNAIAFFGYYSGWFGGMGREKTFCAISGGPLFLITIDGPVRCKRVALSLSNQAADDVRAWASTIGQ